VIGGRVQTADTDAEDFTALTPGAFPGRNIYPVASHSVDGEIDRYSAYVYDMWQIFEPLQLTAGVTYDYLSYPQNQEIAPIGGDDSDRSQISPKAGLIWTPRTNTVIRGAYTRSLGGVFFDNSLRLEPTQVGGFNQSFRSLIPESVVGNVPGTRFETFGLGFDQKFGSGTYLTIAGEVLDSTARRHLGAFRRFSGQIEAVPSITADDIDYTERSLIVALNQLVGDNFSVGLRYRLTDADFEGNLVEISPTVLSTAKLDNEATLHQAQAYVMFNHRSGFFSQVDAIFASQDNRGYTPGLDGDEVVQFNAYVGYRFWRRHAEVKLGLLNIGDKDYKLNPLTLYSELPRERTFYASLKFYF
jgi:outer membrane receptor protein involved in Fe transport